MIERLFVYGTLGTGRPNEAVLSKIGGAWAPACLRGNLVQAGWGTERNQRLLEQRQAGRVAGRLDDPGRHRLAGLGSVRVAPVEIGQIRRQPAHRQRHVQTDAQPLPVEIRQWPVAFG